MLDDRQKDGLRQWYGRPEILEEAQRLIDQQDWEDLEEFIQMRALFPLSRHSELPEYLRTEKGPLIPSNCNPMQDLEGWQDAIEVGWAVVAQALGVSQDDVHRVLAEQQQASWEAFLKSVDQRKQAKKPEPE